MLLKADGDRKSRQDAEAKRVESNQKTMLLDRALKRYKALDFMGRDLDEEEGENVLPSARDDLRLASDTFGRKINLLSSYHRLG